MTSPLVTPAIALFGLLLTSVAAPASASEVGPASPERSASDVRYQRSAPKIDARNEMRERFLDARKKAEAAKAEERAAELEDMRDRERAAQREAINQALTDAKIEKLKELVRQTDEESPELPDLLMRLADLHLDKKAYFELQAGALAEPIDAAEHGVATPKANPPRPAASQSRPAAPESRPKGRRHQRPRR